MLKKNVLAISLLAIGIGISGCTKFQKEYTNGSLSKAEVTRSVFPNYFYYSIDSKDIIRKFLYVRNGLFFRETHISANTIDRRDKLLYCTVAITRGGVVTRRRGQAASLDAFIKEQKNFPDADLVLALLKEGRKLLKTQIQANLPEKDWK